MELTETVNTMVNNHIKKYVHQQVNTGKTNGRIFRTKKKQKLDGR